MANQNYHDQVNIDNSIKLRELMDKLPRFCKEFFRELNLPAPLEQGLLMHMI